MIISVLLLIGGFLLLLKGADWLVEGACSVADRMGISQLVVGLTVVSFGTSTPELFINVMARLTGDSNITIGNILGSNIANIFLILGLAAVLRPIALKRSTVILEIPFAVLAALVLFILGKNIASERQGFFEISRADGLILLIFFLLFLVYIYQLRKKEGVKVDALAVYGCSVNKAAGMIVAGIVGLAVGAKGVVTGGVAFAGAVGIPESVVALSIIALGSTLPEMVTSLVAVLKNRSDVTVGNIIGSNIFNICWILGLSASISPLAIPESYLFDMGLVIGAPALLFGIVFFNKKAVLSRGHGFFFVSLYGLYLLLLAQRV